MIIHVGTEVNMVFGVLKDGNVVEQIPYKINITEVSENTLGQLLEAFKKIKAELDSKVKEQASTES